ncbi:MAG: hypothetical protein WKF35_02575 [Ferruginibacter sp.]
MKQNGGSTWNRIYRKDQFNTSHLFYDIDRAYYNFNYNFIFKNEREYFEQLFISLSFFQDDRAIKLAEDYNKISPNYELINLLATMYLRKGDFFQFEKKSLEAYYYIPSKMQAKFNLFEYYLKRNDSKNALIWSKMILFGPNKNIYQKKFDYVKPFIYFVQNSKIIKLTR